MGLVLNEDQLMLKEAAAGFLADKASIAELRRLRDEGNEVGYCKEVWQEMAGMGWPGVSIGEEFGGLGYGYTGLGIILEQMGRNLSNAPLQASILVGATIIERMASAKQKGDLLPRLAAGEITVSLALQEGNHHLPNHTGLSGELMDNGYVLTGKKVFVVDAHVADKFLVVARTSGTPGDEGGLSLFLVDSDAVGITRERVIMMDSHNSGLVNFEGVKVGVEALLGEPDEAYSPLMSCLDIASIGIAAELLGLSQEAYDRTLHYLKERQQFGEPIGSFQALQHRAAEMYTELELARSIVLKALLAVDAGEDSIAALASACKAKMCAVASLVTNEAIQMHGGIGMTDEFDIGFFIKRARVLQQLFGGYSYHLNRFAGLNGY